VFSNPWAATDGLNGTRRGGAGIRQTLTVLPITAISLTTERYLNDLSPDRQRLPQRSAIYEQR